MIATAQRNLNTSTSTSPAKYDRHVLEGVGHSPHREAPAVVTAAVLDHLSAVL